MVFFKEKLARIGLLVGYAHKYCLFWGSPMARSTESELSSLSNLITSSSEVYKKRYYYARVIDKNTCD